MWVGGQSHLLLVVGLGLVVAVLFWPPWPLTPQAGLDNSWRAGLSWAHQLGLAWGGDVIFTFGPLYFLDYPLANSIGDVLVASLAWIAYAITITCAVSVAIGASRPTLAVRYRLAATLVCSALLMVLPTTNAFQLMHPLVPIALLATSFGAAHRMARTPWVVGLAVGMLALHTLYGAALAGAFALVVVTSALGLSGAARLLVSMSVTFLALWLLDGQSVFVLPQFLAAEFEIVRGYAPAMNANNPANFWQFPLAGALALSCLWCVSRVAHDLPRRARLGFVAGTAVTLWLAAREAFTRHDGHYWHFFALVAVLCLVFLLVRSGRALFSVALATGTVAYLMATTIFVPLLAPVDRLQSIDHASQVLRVVSSPEYATALFDQATRRLADSYAMTPELAQAVRAAPTSADPSDISTLMSVGANWDPLPVIQNYSAYTPALDALDASDLGARPRQILRAIPYPAIDGRNPFWDAPAYQRLIYCSYDVQSTSPKWQLLVPAASTRCSEGESAGAVDLAADQKASVPQRDGWQTLVTVTPRVSLLRAALELLTKPSPVFVAYGEQRWRLGSSPSAVDLMLNAPVPHPAFAGLPLTPYPSISVTIPAHLEFWFVEVAASAAPAP